MDETLSALVPADYWTLDKQGAAQVTIAVLRTQIINEGKTDACPEHTL